jgi:hypothetical protein
MQAAVRIPVRTLTRKKYGTTPPRPKDSIAWNHNGNGKPKQFFRSPLDHDEWISGDARDSLLKEAQCQKKYFHNRHCTVVIVGEVCDGHTGWRKEEVTLSTCEKRHVTCQYTWNQQSGRWVKFIRGR